MAYVYVSVGSNVERERNIRSALQALQEDFGPLEQSRVYETAAVGFEGEPFYNLVVGFETELAPKSLIERLHELEARHGRRREDPSVGDRPLDLDLLLYDELVVEEPGLVLPRAEILHYAFVLGPLAEIAGAKRHPVIGHSFESLWDVFDPTAQPMWPVEL